MCSILFLTLKIPKLRYFEEELQFALSAVRTLKNAGFAAINRFPQEVLALIPTHFDPKIPRNILNASHVCRYWRSAFVSSPTLWTATDTTYMTPRLVLLYLDRSRASPLDVTLGAKTPACILQQFVDRAPQIRFLSFEMMPWPEWKAFSERFSVSALHTLLDLRISINTEDEPAATALNSALFPHTFNLRHFSIRIFGPSAPIWSHIAFPSLTSIQICFQDGSILPRTLAGPVHPIATLSQLLGVFRSSPLLEDVQLTFSTLTTEREVSHRPVALPHLQKFHIFCGPTPVPLLMSITFPSTTSILAETNMGSRPAQEQMLALGQHLSPLISGSNELTFCASEIPTLYAVQFKRDGESRVEFLYYGAEYPLPLSQTLTFIAACPLDAVRRFVVVGKKAQRGLTNDQAFGAMQNLMNVETLVLKNSIHLLHLLFPAIQGGRPLCPRLKTLTINDDQEIPRQELVQVARARAEAGFPLQRVILDAEAFGKVASELRQLVEDVSVGEGEILYR